MSKSYLANKLRQTKLLVNWTRSYLIVGFIQYGPYQTVSIWRIAYWFDSIEGCASSERIYWKMSRPIPVDWQVVRAEHSNELKRRSSCRSSRFQETRSAQSRFWLESCPACFEFFSDSGRITSKRTAAHLKGKPTFADSECLHKLISPKWSHKTGITFTGPKKRVSLSFDSIDWQTS